MSGMRSALTLRMMSTPPVLSSATAVATSGIARKTTYLNAGLPRQCWSKASSRMCWSRFHSTSFQGPVPDGAPCCRTPPRPPSRCASSARCEKYTRRSSRSGNGLSVIRWIVSASTIFTSLIARTLPYCGDFFFSLPGSSTRSNEYFTSSAVMVEPSWNLTPLRSLNSHVVSLSAFHDRASEGSNSSLAERCRSESNMLMLTRMPDALEVHVRVEGRRVRRQRDGERVLALRAGADRRDERREIRARARVANASWRTSLRIVR